MIARKLPALLNHAAFLAALTSICWYCTLVASGDYKKWSYPILIGSTLCKLISVNKSLKDGHSSSSVFNTLRQRLSNSRFGSLLVSTCTSLSHRISNDIHHHNLYILSTAIILLPCAIFYIRRVIRHMSKLTDDGHYDHDELANDFGKLSAASLSFLLIPVSKYLGLLSSINLGEVQLVRMHIYAGTLAIISGVAHGLYYTWIWIALDSNTFDDIFPGAECFQKGYGKQCHSQFVNLLGIVNGVGFVILGCTTLWWMRRHYYNVFYYVHISLSIILLFGLVMHYNKIIWFIAPSLLSYMGSNVPVAFEFLYKWRKGGVGISKVVCIPDSRGCVELTIASKSDDSSDGQDDGQEAMSGIGKFVRLTVPDISAKSHPFTTFYDPRHPQDAKILFRPIGAFTTELSSRLKSLATSPEPTPSELSVSTDTRAWPKMLVNGVSTSSDMLRHAWKHDNIVIIAGGVGIVPYINLIWALADINSNSEESIDEGERSGIQKSRRIQVHWISRDEGLIKYIIENYFSSRRKIDEDLSSSLPVAMTISVHHTGAATSSMHTVDDEQDTLTQVIPQETARTLESSTSLYQGRNLSLTQNFLPALVLAAISFGGAWIINHCYEFIQDKHVIETRCISVSGILLWAVLISIGSQALVRMTDALSRAVAYSKLESNACDGNGIELNTVDRFVIDDEATSREENNETEESESINLTKEEEEEEDQHYDQDFDTSISHLQGRPDIDSIIKTAFEEARGEETDIGIFMCGPSSLTAATSNAISIENEKHRSGHCLANTSIHHSGAFVYEEKFEL